MAMARVSAWHTLRTPNNCTILNYAYGGTATIYIFIVIRVERALTQTVH